MRRKNSINITKRVIIEIVLAIAGHYVSKAPNFSHYCKVLIWTFDLEKKS